MKYKIISYLLCCYMIFSQMNPDASSTFFNESFASPGGNSIRVVSYNIHFGASKKGKPAISVVSRFLSLVDPDILCLQEVDQNTIRSLFLDQSTKLNKDLSMKIAYGITDNVILGKTGNLILSKFPILSVKNRVLPSSKYKRSALKVTLKTPIGKINVINTHLSLSRKERKKQIEIIKAWILEDRLPTILAGDFNTTDMTELKPLLYFLNDPADITNQTHLKTFKDHKYNARIDYIFVPKTYFIKSYGVSDFDFSDHYPVIVDIY